MLARIRTLGKEAVLYGVGFAVVRALGFLLVPIYTRFLGTEGYGVVSVAASIAGVLGILGGLGLTTTVVRLYHAPEHSEGDLFKTALLLVSAATTVIVIGSLAILLSANPIYNPGELVKPALVIAIVTLLFQNGSEIVLAVYRAERKPTGFVIQNTGRFVLSAGVALWLVVVLNWGTVGYMTGMLIGASLVFALTALSRFICSPGRVNKMTALPLIRLGSPLVVSGIALWALDLSDRLLLAHFRSLSDVGIYSLGYSFASIVYIVYVTFQTVWLPFVFKESSQDSLQRTVPRVFTYFLGSLLVLTAVLASFAGEVIGLIAPVSFAPATRVVLPVALGYVSFGVFQLLISFYLVDYKFSLYSLVLVGAATGNLLLNLALIPYAGMTGAAWATFISYLGAAAISLLLVRNRYSVSFELARIAILLGTCAATIVLAALLDEVLGSASWFVKVLSFLALPVWLHFMRFFNVEEKELLSTALARLRGVLRWRDATL